MIRSVTQFVNNSTCTTAESRQLTAACETATQHIPERRAELSMSHTLPAPSTPYPCTHPTIDEQCNGAFSHTQRGHFGARARESGTGYTHTPY